LLIAGAIAIQPIEMRILIASDPGANPYLGSLITGLNSTDLVTSVMSGAILFWMLPKNVDILHIQWPEVLFPGGRDPSEVELAKLEERLEEWKKRTRIVASIHNRIPHFRKTDRARRLFATIYKHCDGIIHFGERSVEAFKEDFPMLGSMPHAVIPHGNYAFFENTVSPAEARRRLEIDPERFVVLAFGQMRHQRELRCLLQGFLKFKHRSKTLLIAGRMFCPHHFIIKACQFLQRHSKLPVLIHNRFIPDTEVQHFLNAADVLVIPHMDQLNSGNVALGFTFGKVVVGPATGVIGETLQQAGNPTFVPGNARSLAAALNEATELMERGKGRENQKLALEVWSWPRIAKQHVEFYSRIMTERLEKVVGGIAGNQKLALLN
jgi:beta-1,4-mannosyltransferase